MINALSIDGQRQHRDQRSRRGRGGARGRQWQQGADAFHPLDLTNPAPVCLETGEVAPIHRRGTHPHTGVELYAWMHGCMNSMCLFLLFVTYCSSVDWSSRPCISFLHCCISLNLKSYFIFLAVLWSIVSRFVSIWQFFCHQFNESATNWWFSCWIDYLEHINVMYCNKLGLFNLQMKWEQSSSTKWPQGLSWCS